MKAIATEGLTAGAHDAVLTEVSLFSTVNRFGNGERVPVLRLTWVAESGKTNQLVNLQVENGNVKVNKASKLGKIIAALGVSLTGGSEIDFGSPAIDSAYENAEALSEAPDLKEMSEEGFRPVTLTYFAVDGESILKRSAIINVIEDGTNIKIENVIPALKKAKTRNTKPITQAEETSPF